MSDALAAIDHRVGLLEGSVPAGLARLEQVILREINELKTEQLKDIKGTIDRVERDLKDEHRRLADDQRRIWERLNDVERRTNDHAAAMPTLGNLSKQVTELARRDDMRAGAGRVRGSIWHVASGLLGGLITTLGMLLSGHGTPPPAH